MRLPPSARRAGSAAAGLALALAACTETTAPLATPAPDAGGAHELRAAALACTARPREGTLSCRAPGAAAGAAAGDVLVGWQNVYVRLESGWPLVHDVADPAVRDTFQFDVTVTNLLPQSMGTEEWAWIPAWEIEDWVPHPNGVRVFFHAGPAVTAGAGVAEVANASGTGTFSGANQPFFQYDQVLDRNDESDPVTWKIAFDEGVDAFDFVLYVSTAVPYPNGWVDMPPYRTVPLFAAGDTVRMRANRFGYLGNAIPTTTFSWASDAPGVATVDGNGLVTATGAQGFAWISALAGTVGPRNDPESPPASRVSVCTPTPVAVGDTIAAELTAGSCASLTGQGDFAADWYLITLAAGDTVTILQRTGGLPDTFLALARLDGELLEANDDLYYPVYGLSAGIVFVAPETGTYLIDASAYDPRFLPSGLGTYTLEVFAGLPSGGGPPTPVDVAGPGPKPARRR